MEHYKAVIYCRVSDVKQTIRGDGLASQKTRCEEYARNKGYTVVKTYTDDKSGSLIDRPGMKAMLAYLRRHRKEQLVVIIDDISRLARGIKAHWTLRDAINKAGGSLESPTVEFGEDADSEMQEYILATIAQHQRRKNAEQTKNRMRARVMNGYWTFQAPRGYKYAPRRGQGRILVPDEPLAGIVKTGLEGFASGRFGSQMDVARYFENQAAYPKDKATGGVPQQRIANMLKQPLYAGYIEYPDWGISLCKAQNEPLISLETFHRIQDRLNEGQRLASRRDLHEDFPLRGFIQCPCCSKPLTAYWARSATKKQYKYYECFNKDCELSRKSVSGKKIEAAFEKLLKHLQPAPEVAALLRDVLAHVSVRRQSQKEDNRADFKAQIRATDREIDQLLTKIVDMSVPSAISAFERKIAELERHKLVLKEQMIKKDDRQLPLDEVFELSMRILSTPWDIWEKGSLKARRLLLKLVFSEPLVYQSGTGFRTPQKTLPFNILEAVSAGERKMARPGRFELPTP